jgi:polyhydroxyalkanoate synthesis regulator protein
MSENEVLLIEVRNGQLYEAESNMHVGRGDLAWMITTGRKYKVVDPKTGEDVTRNLGRHIGRCR